MISKLSLKKRFFLYSIFLSFFAGASFYIYLLCTTKSNVYYIDFDSSVAGLKNGCGVNYKGLNIGVVEDIVIKEDLDVVRVTIKTDYYFKMYADYIPTINMQGLAGVCVIELTRDKTLQHELLESKTIIKGRMSYIESFLDTLDRANQKCSALINNNNQEPENIINVFERILDNLEKFSKQLLDSDINKTVKKIDGCVENIQEAINRAEVQEPRLWRWVFGSKKK